MHNLFRQGAFQGTRRARHTSSSATRRRPPRTTSTSASSTSSSASRRSSPPSSSSSSSSRWPVRSRLLEEDGDGAIQRQRAAFDPYKNFKFRVKWDGNYVAGVSKVGALKRTTEVVKHREGGDPSSSRKSPGRTEYEAITLERGVTHDTEFEQWANKVWNFGSGLGAEVSLKDFRKDIIIEVYNEAGQLATAPTRSTAAGSRSIRSSPTWTPMRTRSRSSTSSWRTKAGSATTKCLSRMSRPLTNRPDGSTTKSRRDR